MDTRRILEFLDKSQNIGIVTPKDPNVDQMGAALALYLSILETGKNVAIATPNEPLVELSSLVGIDKVKTKLDYQTGDLVVSFPYKEGEIEKVSYTEDNGLLNIVVKAGEKGLSFDPKDVKFIRPQGAPELLFVVGANKLSDLGKLFDVSDLKDTTVVNIDNNPENQGFGDILMVTIKASSVSEIVSEFLLSSGLKQDTDIAQNLLDGISFATNNFQNPKTSVVAFQMVAELMRLGAVREPNQALRTAFTGKNQPTQVQTAQIEPTDKKNPPEDWLAPKIYKGSTNF